MSTVSGSLITRNYTGFRGVDFTDNEVSLTRSPDSLNMWKDYSKLGKCIETRPEIELVEAYDNTIFGLFFYKVGNTEMKLVHSGTTLYKEANGVREILYTGLNPKKSNSFIYNNIWYFKDGINYLQYNGETIGEVTGYIPTTSISRKPEGGGAIYEDVNMMTGWRKNTFLADGTSTDYYLDAKPIDSNSVPIVIVNNEATTDFTVDYTNGIIKFNTAPIEPLTVGQDNVSIQFKKTVSGYRDRINKCTLLQVFDNRVFFSGNQDYPNTVWHCSLNDPSYCSDLDYYNEGLDLSPVTGMVAGNNALWVFKKPSQANTTVFYHNPTIDAAYGKVYPSTHSSISTGCVGGAINFNDDIAFFSDRGMEAINGDVTTEQVIAHRSSMVDSKLLAEANYEDMILEEWKGYLLVITGNHVYLADSRSMFTNQDHNEYEWFYWELEKDVTCTKVKDGVLYLCTDDGIYSFSYNEEEYTEVTFTEENGEYVLYGESKQNGEPTPDTPVEIVNTYKAGKYRATINGKQYRFELTDDLRSAGTYKDRLYLDNTGLHLTKNIGEIILGSPQAFYSGTLFSTPCQYGVYLINDAMKMGRSYEFISNKIAPTKESFNKYAGYFNEASIIALTDTEDTVENFSSKLMGSIVYYPLGTPVTTDINYTISPLSYWITPYDEFNYPQYQKTTNKRGSVTDIKGTDITISTKIDDGEYEDIVTHENITSYVVNRIKKKKWKGIQIKFSSNKPFELFSSTLEAYVGGYVKR